MTRRDQVNVRRGKRELLALAHWGLRGRVHRWCKRYAWRVMRREDALAGRREIEEHARGSLHTTAGGGIC